jgi:Ca2+-binding EF-hand superfamily protein
LYKRFQLLDKDNRGRIAPQDLFAIPELAVNPLSPRIVLAFDKDQRNEISFKQFIESLSVFSKNAKREDKLSCTWTCQVFHLLGAFKIYDVDGDGFINEIDLFTIIQSMLGSNVSDEQIRNIVQKTIADADVLDSDGSISFAEFKRSMFNADLENILSIEL